MGLVSLGRAPKQECWKHRNNSPEIFPQRAIISKAADDNHYVVMASLDLSMAFDLVNTELLIKTLKIIIAYIDGSCAVDHMNCGLVIPSK